MRGGVGGVGYGFCRHLLCSLEYVQFNPVLQKDSSTENRPPKNACHKSCPFYLWRKIVISARFVRTSVENVMPRYYETH